MKIHESLNHFWEALVKQNTGKFKFDTWTIVRFTHTSDAEYAQQIADGKDPLGFQPLLVILANPLAHESRREIIRDINNQAFLGFWQHYTAHFMTQLDSRFGSFRPEKFDAYTEYDTWEHFKESWLERQGKPVISQNFPLIFDHMPQAEHWARQQSGQEVLSYQRLIVTTYFVSKDLFFDFIIKDVSDAEMDHIKLLTKSRVGLHLYELFTPAH